ncbi:hypothetical protein FNV43_RR22840 [Rhamnella rubrinervis]|uniref:Uncharacterized protein n=1 Tax=Rhamnella rubrinervis TaxID=2594499 RepID=A0A8K0GSU6_9ROSA|nr:hypothetical protein FNV43_RR22840 [Rhamnella rubrinervis]
MLSAKHSVDIWGWRSISCPATPLLLRSRTFASFALRLRLSEYGSKKEGSCVPNYEAIASAKNVHLHHTFCDAVCFGTEMTMGYPEAFSPAVLENQTSAAAQNANQSQASCRKKNRRRSSQWHNLSAGLCEIAQSFRLMMEKLGQAHGKAGFKASNAIMEHPARIHDVYKGLENDETEDKICQVTH